MALAVRNITPVDGLGNMEDEPHRDSGERDPSGWDKHEIKRKISHSLEKVAKEVDAENISAGMSIRPI